MTVTIRKLELTLSVCRLGPDHAVEPWMQAGTLWSVTRTADELSVICEAERVPASVRHHGPFTAFAVAGPLDFALTGVVAALGVPLATARIPLLVFSTFDTDYVLIEVRHVAAAVLAWRDAGLHVRA